MQRAFVLAARYFPFSIVDMVLRQNIETMKKETAAQLRGR